MNNYDQYKWKVYTWKNWMLLHWIINPGLAFNELLLGQRVPKLSLEERSTTKSRFERSFIPCPHCNKIHDSRTWSTQNSTAFKNWFGLYCPNCGDIIPCLINGLSFIILVITFPIWGWFKKALKSIWLKKQPARFQNIDFSKVVNPFEGSGWIKQGLSWGVAMFVFMTFIFPLIFNESITLKKILFGIIIWTIAGLCFGFVMKMLRAKKSSNDPINKSSN